MNCASIQEDLSAYQDGELPSQRSREIEAHLAGCASCRSQLAQFHEVWDLLGTFPTIEPSGEFRTGFWQKVRQEEDKRWSWRFFPRWAPVFAGFLVIWVSGLSIGTSLFMRSPQVESAKYASDASASSSLVAAYLRHMPRDQ